MKLLKLSISAIKLLQKELSKHTWKLDEKRGWMRNDMGFVPAK